MSEPHAAMHWVSDEGRVHCLLCPQGCRISDGKAGLCGIRRNVKDELKAIAYGHYPAIHMDPIEKKPLYHFLPGSEVLSIGSVGCNLTCKMCQNWTLSRSGPEIGSPDLTVERLLSLSLGSGNPSVAFTYNEPTINFEYVMEASELLRANGIRSVLVTNGYLQRGPWEELMGRIDATNIDVKGFTDRFYTQIAGGHLQPVLDNVRTAFKKGVHVEIAYLVIPGENDTPEELRAFARWVKVELTGDLPVHFTRFHPDYRMTDRPMTPQRTLELARSIAQEEGLKNVYIGNMTGPGYNDTFCPKCTSLTIARSGYSVDDSGMDNGKCRKCAKAIWGVFE